jgi:hypothetical protein
MKTSIDNASMPVLDVETPGATPDLFLEIDPQEKNTSFRLPVRVKNLADEGVILEVFDLPSGLNGETLLQKEAVIHLVPDGVTKETRLRSKVVWTRQGERGACHFLLGLDLNGADFRTRRILEKLVARPKDMSKLWTYWDQVQAKPADHPNNGRIVFYLGAVISLGGLGLKATLPDSYDVLAMTLTLLGIYVIAGKFFWDWWHQRTVHKEGAEL